MLCCPGLAAVSDGSCVPGTPGLGFPSSHGVKLFCISLAAQVWVGLSGKKKLNLNFTYTTNNFLALVWVINAYGSMIPILTDQKLKLKEGNSP